MLKLKLKNKFDYEIHSNFKIIETCIPRRFLL